MKLLLQEGCDTNIKCTITSESFAYKTVPANAFTPGYSSYIQQTRYRTQRSGQESNRPHNDTFNNSWLLYSSDQPSYLYNPKSAHDLWWCGTLKAQHPLMNGARFSALDLAVVGIETKVHDVIESE